MPKQIDLTATPRRDVGRSAAKRARRAGAIPAILYGKRSQPMPISVPARQMEELLRKSRGTQTMVNLIIDDNSNKVAHLALIQDVQIDPVEDDVLHVDFLELSATEKFRARVSVKAVGDAAGVKEGGILEYLVREIEIECLPKDLPEFIAVDVSELKIGQSIRLGDIKPPPGVEIRGDKSLAVFTVTTPTTEEQIAAEAEAAPGEPEVITAKKEEGAPPEAEAAAKPEAAAAKPEAGAGADAKAAAAKLGAAAPAKAAPAGPAAPAAKPEAKGKGK